MSGRSCVAMNALLALVVLARCAVGQEFNDAVAEGIMNELTLELRGPWSTLDFDAALKDNTLSEARVAQALARLERTRGFRRELRNSTIAPFEPSDAFRQFISSSTATGADPTWETVVG